jgi:3-dehydroquinate synthase
MSWIEDYQKKITYQASNKFLANLQEQECFIITDKNLENIYQKDLFPTNKYFSINPGELSKTFQKVNEILEVLLELHYSRNVLIIGFGGGVVCDIAGFVSAIYKRGCRLALMPTSLIAMVDASIGGKNGVNSRGYKNQFGTIKQADYINVDFALLKSLNNSEFANGLPEILKHGLLFSNEYYQKVTSFCQQSKDEQTRLLPNIIKESIAIKLSFVSGDESDKQQRMCLNFGHTLGHVIEKQYSIPHGQAVLWGMIQAIKLSCKLEYLSESQAKCILADLTKYNTVDENMIKWKDISQALEQDKKREGKDITFILLKGVGRPLIHNIDLETIKEIF